MVAARKAFLDSGFYAPIATAISQLCTDHLDTAAPLAILDAGCGEGYYLQALCAALDTPEREIIATGLDISGIRNFWLIKCQRCKEENLSQRII